ncbi:GGDEF and EAL domain-containing protein [Ruminococcus sp.]|uniref:putative bifunctional diguanylate cyclase/phosphodiesterase n=1 Tax=Ruminococcus sp. TaxID=41978 RepID=UPI0025D282BE|nr:GGDEF and EAL domain-containing protein [Ruminococcus sp.]MBQ8966616.1 EAL domain-containing protein [Ruminococcus sp.]
MEIRVRFSIIFTVLVVMLIISAVRAYKSERKIGKSVAMLELSLLPPLLGNLIIIGASVRIRALVGSYIYLVGMDMVMLALVNFTDVYCTGIGNGRQKPTVVYLGLVADIVQLLLNTFFGHAFGIEPVNVQGLDYYRLVPRLGQNIHRVVDYGVFFCVMLIFILASVKTSRLFREKFTVLLGSMIVVAVWQTFYIITRRPVDRSMIGYGVLGLLVCYLSIDYRPLRLLDRMLSDIVSDMSEALFVYDPTGRCIWANAEGQRLTGTDEKSFEKAEAALAEIFGTRGSLSEEWNENRVIGRGHEAKYYSLEHHVVNDSGEQISGSYLVVRDNTEEQRRIKREIYNSTHDSLTGLYTKQYLYESVRSMLENDPDTEYAAIFVDVKNFKIVNDIFSTAFGDMALLQIAGWISRDMTEKCLLGRLAGDTFGVFLPAEQFERDKPRIEEDLADFVVTDGTVEHHLVMHLGVYEVTERDVDVSVMFDRAHLALSTITDDYNTPIAYYDKDLRDKILWEQRITAGLREAIETRQLRPYLQPITDRNAKVVGAEALARWIHPEQGFMPPSSFIPIFEKNGMITEVDKHMWRCACEILAGWKGKHDDLFISVNISPKDFYFIDVVGEIKGLVEEYGIDPVKLRIEVTETVMMNDPEESMKMLAEFRRLGFIVEMDDFGSGYSSLNLLKDMPVDVLKIDMRFLSVTGSSDKGRTIVGNIIRLSEELEISSLTEGVETEQQYYSLADMGCRLFQGYYFAKPMPLEEFEEFAFGNEKRTE